MLAKLGVYHVGALMALPETGLRKHFGAEIERLVQAAKGTREVPLQNTAEETPLVETVRLDEAESDCERLLFIVKRALQPLLLKLAKAGEALARLELHLQLEKRARESTSEVLRETIAPHEPMLEIAPLMELVRLKLMALLAPCEGKSVGAVLSLALRAIPAPANQAQLVLFAETPKRDLRAAERAFARLRAEFGPNAVVCAAEREGHLPEARFAWQPLSQVTTPAPKKAGFPASVSAVLASQSPRLVLVSSAEQSVQSHVSQTPKLTLVTEANSAASKPPPVEVTEYTVRRFFPQAIALGSRKDPNDGWLIAGLELGAVTKLLGPYIQSGNWWRTEVQRDYYFAEVKRGDQLWVYFDHNTRSFFLAGTLA
jgi:protein ImuB